MTRENHNEPSAWDGKERRSYIVLSPDQIERMLEEAAKRGAAAAFQEIYALLGAGVARKTLLLIGAAILALLAWLTQATGITFPIIQSQVHEVRK